MARTGRPKAPLTVTDAERADLVRGSRAATSTQAYALRCRIVLACAEPGAMNSHVAAELGVSVPTVAKWRRGWRRRAAPARGRGRRGGRPAPPPPRQDGAVGPRTAARR